MEKLKIMFKKQLPLVKEKKCIRSDEKKGLDLQSQ